MSKRNLSHNTLSISNDFNELLTKDSLPGPSTLSLNNDVFNTAKPNNSNWMFSRKSTTKQLTRDEREQLFNEAEKKRSAGKVEESATLFMRCLSELDVNTAFPSLPKCLRALANHFLEQEEYIKSIHFVQAERLFYESALMDAAALQKKLTDMSGGYVYERDSPYSNLKMNATSGEKPPKFNKSKKETLEELELERKRTEESKQKMERQLLSTDTGINSEAIYLLDQKLNHMGDDNLKKEDVNNGDEASTIAKQIPFDSSYPAVCPIKQSIVQNSNEPFRNNYSKSFKDVLLYALYIIISALVLFVSFVLIFTIMFGPVNEIVQTTESNFMYESYETKKNSLLKFLVHRIESVQDIIYSITNLIFNLTMEIWWTLTSNSKAKMMNIDDDKDTIWVT